MLVECHNALWKNAMVYGKMSLESAFLISDIILNLVKEEVIVVEPTTKYLKTGFEIAVRHGITMYDSVFIAQAKDLDADLLTCDLKQYGTAKKEDIRTVFIQ